MSNVLMRTKPVWFRHTSNLAICHNSYISVLFIQSILNYSCNTLDFELMQPIPSSTTLPGNGAI
jgi:hypothetical protein